MYLLFDFCGEKAPSCLFVFVLSFFFFFLPFFPPSSSLLLSLPGLRGGDKWLLFSVAKKGTSGSFQQNLQAWWDEKKRRGEGGERCCEVKVIGQADQ